MYNKYQLQYFKSRRRFVSAVIFLIAVFIHTIHYGTLPSVALYVLLGLLCAALFHTWKMMDFYLDCWIEDVMPNSEVHTFGEARIDREWAKYQQRRKTK